MNNKTSMTMQSSVFATFSEYTLAVDTLNEHKKINEYIIQKGIKHITQLVTFLKLALN